MRWDTISARRKADADPLAILVEVLERYVEENVSSGWASPFRGCYSAGHRKRSILDFHRQ
jgi:hypothetical protein